MKNKLFQVPALATIALVSACTHAALQPPANASSEERIAAYERLRPQADVAVLGRDGVVVDGRAVTDARDLLPVLDPETPAARAARRSATARHRQSRWAIGGLIVAGAGMTLGVADLVSTSYVAGHGSGPLRGDTDRIGAAVGMTTLVIGLLAGDLGQMYYGQIASREEHVAFVTYDASLRQSLRVCTQGLAVTDCDAHAQGTTAAR